MESSRSKKCSSQACHCICWKCNNFNPSVGTKNCLDLYPMATHGIDSGKNHIVLLPMENRHSHVYELLLKRNILKDILYLFQTIKHIFSHEHEDLVQKGGQWLASKANSFPVVATLVATVAFTTSAAVPGGTKKTALHIFAIS
ncbi:hypothetical protein PVL29_008375 [Vitis rotundifolia]|uniref:PGG domain-containing protein n=1 Tax=Vitis rotundifolia TaxID=103349 RepID=A0AA38ZW18_VITRO|nr:hypothetical protein PVL29_008375 [Vitis rotundifolia]